MMKTKFLQLLVVAATVLSVNATMAHGPKAAKFGGTVATAGDLGFELAVQGDTVTVYVDDHGTPLPTAGMSGKLTLLKGAEKSEAVLVAAAPNKLEAKGLKLSAGTKAVAVVTLADKKVVTVRFTTR